MQGNGHHARRAQFLSLKDGSEVVRLGLFLSDAAAGDAGGDNTGWMHVAMSGEWEGHREGPFVFDEAFFSAMIDEFEAIENPIVVDYEHRSENKDSDGRAAGWITELEVRGSGDDADLWAKVEWTEKAATMIREREYRFCSPAIHTNLTDRKTNEPLGPFLSSVALTNHPFLDGQTPLQLSRRQSMANKTKTLKLTVKEALTRAANEIDDDATESDAWDALYNNLDQDKLIEAIRKVQGEGGTQLSLEQTAVTGDGSGAEPTLDPLIKSLAESTGMDPAAIVAAMQDKRDQIQQLIEGAASADGTEAEMSDVQKAMAMELRAIKAQQSKYGELLLSLQRAEKEREEQAEEEEERRAAADVDASIEAGKLAESDRDEGLELRRKSPSLFLSRFGASEGTARSEKVPPGRQANKGEGGSRKVEPEAEPRVIELANRIQKMGVRKFDNREGYLAHARHLLEQQDARAN